MPVMDGFTMTNNLRTLGVKTPILILTADASAAVKVTAKTAGATGLFLNPFETHILIEVVGKAIG